jgi:hypothetical protein
LISVSKKFRTISAAAALLRKFPPERRRGVEGVSDCGNPSWKQLLATAALEAFTECTFGREIGDVDYSTSKS